MPDTPAPPAHRTKTIMVPKVVNGYEQMVEIQVDDDSQGPSWPDRSQMSVLDKPIKRVDGPDKVTGRARYTHDVRLHGMLYARILPSPYASAVVTAIDASRAQSIPGVDAVITYAGKTLRYQGDPVAAVAAQTPEIAEDAIRAIAVTYTVNRHAVDYDTAVGPDAPPVYPSGNVRPGGSSGTQSDAEAAFATCAAVVEGDFETSFQHHSCLETHGVVVDCNGDSATVYASTQGTFSIPSDAAQALQLDPSVVTSVVDHMGGGFGSKSGLDLPGSIACQLALQTRRPIHLMLTRADEFVMAGNRSASRQHIKLGGNKDGTLVAISAQQHRLGGLGGGSQPRQPYIYRVPIAYASIDSVHMNIDSSRAFRAPGCPQASFAMESIMDDLAAALDIDPIDLRKANVGQPDIYARQLAIGAESIGWAAGRNPRPGAGQTGMVKRGMGVGLSAWNGGGGPGCEVTVTIAPDAGVDVSVGSQDLGTGTRTYVAAIAAEELGLPVDAVRAHIGNSTFGNANGSGGSTTTAGLAPGVLTAAYNARQALFSRIAPALGAKPEELTAAEGRVVTASGKSVTWSQACSILGTAPVTAHGEWSPTLSGNGVHGAQFAEVEVNTETGKVRVLKFVTVQDCGLPLNRSAIESQLNGGVIQGIGYALYEGKVTDKDTGLMLNDDFETYKLPGTLEIPEIVAIIDDADTRNVIGMSEPATIPTSGAVANAVFNACGVRVRSLPITPDKVLAGLADLQTKGATT